MNTRLFTALVAALSLAAGCSAEKADCKGDAVVCGGSCVSTKSDNQNCGACGIVCDSGTACSTGQCVTSCPSGELACGSKCIDPLTDRTFCGATDDCLGANAGTVCRDGELCDGTGTCNPPCVAPLANCNGTCIDPTSDSSHCGASGSCLGVRSGSVCLNGRTCVASRCSPAWQPIATSGAPAARIGHAAATLGGRYHVFGGTLSGSGALVDGGIFDPATNTWSALPPLGSARCGHGAAATGTAIYSYGGLFDCSSGGATGPALEVFDGVSWSPAGVTGAPAGRYNIPMVWTGSKIFVYGGSGAGWPATASGALFDPLTDEWTDASCGLPGCERGGNFSAFLDGTSIRIWGGGPFGSAPQGLRYDLLAETWSEFASPPGSPTDASVLYSTNADDGQRHYVLKGASDCSGNVDVHIYDRRTGAWVLDSATAPAGLSGGPATAWVDGELIAWSGQCSGGYSTVGGRYQPPPPTP